MIEIDGKKIYYPIKYVPKDYQIDALNFIKKSIMTGNKFILLNLPTGTGKSFIISTLFTNWYKNFVNSSAKFDLLTNSKVLQNQYIKDFDFINNFKGKNNYYCKSFDCQVDVGKDLCKTIKNNCKECPYDKAKNKWLFSDIGLLNFHLFNTLTIYQPDILKNRNTNVLIIDESHDMESTFSDFLSTKISAKTLKKCGLNLKDIEKLDDKYISKIKYLDKYIEFIERKLIPILKEKQAQFEAEVDLTHQSKKKIELTQFIQNIKSKLFSFEHLFESYKNDPTNIVLEINTNNKEKMFSGISLTSQHIWVYEHINEYVWKHYDHIIFMSASILDKHMFSFINGLDADITTYYEIPTPFDLKNRKIYYLKVGKMNYSSKEETFKKQIPWIKNILAKYKNKGIIHTTNYEITEWIKNNIYDERLLFHDTENRNEILEKHLTSSEPTVLVSPSMMSGIDLKDDLARFQILLKIPYPNISSPKIKARQKSNQDWYSLKTSMDLLQMYGRTTRSMDDFSDTFILDSNFSDILKYNKYLPKYFIDAVKFLKI
ncbi:DEAD/DEAH box helicase family protein [Candidatus Dojkabacteria bacterium]|jgi:Rad3-related DNA helicase|nr:DEAD/DEAH box helicase family protein [Candidatus Dojkabacteria bacterium]